MRSGRTFVAGVLFVLALLALAAGVVYLTVPAHSLPAFFPGHLANVHAGKRTKRGTAGIAAGVVLLVIAIAVVAYDRRHRHHRHHRR